MFRFPLRFASLALCAPAVSPELLVSCMLGPLNSRFSGAVPGIIAGGAWPWPYPTNQPLGSRTKRTTFKLEAPGFARVLTVSVDGLQAPGGGGGYRLDSRAAPRNQDGLCWCPFLGPLRSRNLTRYRPGNGIAHFQIEKASFRARYLESLRRRNSARYRPGTGIIHFQIEIAPFRGRYLGILLGFKKSEINSRFL